MVGTPNYVKILFNSISLHKKKQLAPSLSVQKLIPGVHLGGFQVNSIPKLCQNIFRINIDRYFTKKNKKTGALAKAVEKI